VNTLRCLSQSDNHKRDSMNKAPDQRLRQACSNYLLRFLKTSFQMKTVSNKKTTSKNSDQKNSCWYANSQTTKRTKNKTKKPFITLSEKRKRISLPMLFMTKQRNLQTILPTFLTIDPQKNLDSGTPTRVTIKIIVNKPITTRQFVCI
jgi:hypothetical protein